MAWWWHGPSAAVHPQGFVDDRYGDVMVVRPMREYMAKEIAFYNHFFDVPTVVAPPVPTKVRTSPVPWWGGSQALHPHGGNGTLPPPPSCPCPLRLLPQRQEKPSIHRLMERFLLGLQEDFPSTISTVYRYGVPCTGTPQGEGGWFLVWG